MRVFEVQNSRPENKCIMFIEDSWYLYSWLFLILFSFFFPAETEPHEGKRKVESLWPIFRLHHQRSRYIFDLFYKRKAISRGTQNFHLISINHFLTFFCLWRLLWSIVATQHLLFVIVIILSPVCSSNAFCNTFGILVSFGSSVLWCGNVAKKVD